jgi:hypothetical protein
VAMHKTTRVSIDFPYEWHIFLKMYCAKKGISIRQYIIDTVLKSMDVESDEVDDATFKKAADKLLKDKSDLWKRLADK